MEHLSTEQNQAFYLDSVYLPGSSLFFPSNELSNALSSYVYKPDAVPGSSDTETICRTKVQELLDTSEKKKNQRKGSSQATGLSKCKSRRMKKSCCGKKEVEKETPSDFIRVRARRGQATDSHSLAERMRRERISKRMEILQGLVPGCDKVTGKALVLDEIINYVQSLKIQVELLSMKLASVSPILYEYGFVFDGFSSTPELLGDNAQVVPSMIGSSHIQTPADNFTVMATSPTLLLGQDAGDFFMQVSEQNDALDHQVELYGMCSFEQK